MTQDMMVISGSWGGGGDGSPTGYQTGNETRALRSGQHQQARKRILDSFQTMREVTGKWRSLQTVSQIKPHTNTFGVQTRSNQNYAVVVGTERWQMPTSRMKKLMEHVERDPTLAEMVSKLHQDTGLQITIPTAHKKCPGINAYTYRNQTFARLFMWYLMHRGMQ